MKGLNNSNFDILIFSINQEASLSVIKFIIDQIQYRSFNYYIITEKKQHWISLHSAILKNNFEIAYFLLKKKKG